MTERLPGTRKGRRAVQRIQVRCRSCGQWGWTSTVLVGGRKRAIDACGSCKRRELRKSDRP